MLILSHRGYHQHVPENTQEAFQAAVDLGVDGIETDLRLTLDGALVLIHDRVTPDGRLVGEVTRDELERLLGHEVPLAEAALARWPELLWNLEIKTPAAVAASLELIHRLQRSHRLLVTSFWHTVVEEVARQSEADCGWLIAHRPATAPGASSLAWPPLTAEAPFWCRRISTIVWNYEFLDPAAVQAAAQAGYRNFCYAIATPDEHAAAPGWGFDGIITDRPEFALQAQT
jgi:glycerophosphoryl diester phosphodiesterase